MTSTFAGRVQEARGDEAGRDCARTCLALGPCPSPPVAAIGAASANAATQETRMPRPPLPQSTLERSPPRLPVPQSALPLSLRAPRSVFCDIHSPLRACARAAVVLGPGPQQAARSRPNGSERTWLVVTLPPPEGGQAGLREPNSLVRGRPATVFAMRPPLPLALEAAALRAAGALSRVAGRGGGTTLPGKLLWKLDPGAIDRLARATAARRRARLGDEREDDVGGDGRGDPAAARADRPQRLRREPRLRASPPPCSTPATRSSASSRSTRPRSPRSRGASSRARCCSATSSATSSTATASSRPSPPAGATPSPRCRTTCLVVNGDDPQVGDLARDHGRSRIFGLDDPRHARPALQHAADSKYCLRCGTPYDYAAAYVGHLGDYRCPELRPRASEARRRRTRDRAARPRRLVVHAHRPGGEARVELPLPGLYNVYNALGAAALALALGRAARRCRRRAASASRPRSAASSGSRSATAALLMLLIKNPAGANEAVRTLVEGAAPSRRRDRTERRDRRRP